MFQNHLAVTSKMLAQSPGNIHSERTSGVTGKPRTGRGLQISQPMRGVNKQPQG